MPFVILPTNSASGGYDITNSARFNSGSSDFLNKTFGTATNRKIFTISVWTKRSKLGDPATGATGMTMFSGGIANSAQTSLEFTNTNVFSFMDIASPYSAYNFIVRSSETNLVIRDLSAWYHLVVAYDSTQATASNRIKLYLNGSQVTSFNATSYPTLNYEPNMNNNIVHRIGNTMDNTFGDRYYNGYLSEFNFIDGQALTPSSFGETDTDTGIWKPKAYTGTYGTNGFYLQFKNSASLGTDSSGNGNTFTVNNLTSVDQSTDTPTNNFATLNPLVATGGTYTEGNLQYQTSTTDGNWSWSSITPSSSGNWYCEAKMISSSNGTYQLGITSVINGTPRILYVSNGAVYLDGSNVATYATFTTNDIISMAYNSSTKSLTFYKNGVSQGSQTATSTDNYYFGSTAQSGGDTHTIAFNFGSPSYAANSYADGAGYGNFSYAVPSGYYSLNTRNLANFG